MVGYRSCTLSWLESYMSARDDFFLTLILYKCWISGLGSGLVGISSFGATGEDELKLSFYVAL